MAQYEYFAAPFIGAIKSGQGVNEVAKQLTDFINYYVSQGWEFQELGNVNIRVKPGCLAAMFGASDTYLRYDQIIFRRQVA